MFRLLDAALIIPCNYIISNNILNILKIILIISSQLRKFCARFDLQNIVSFLSRNRDILTQEVIRAWEIFEAKNFLG